MRAHACRQRILVLAAQVGALLEHLAIALQRDAETRCSRNGRKTFCAEGMQEQRAAAEGHRAGIARPPRASAVQLPLADR